MKLVLILDNVRSALNVGNLWRSADAAGAEAVWTCGITAHPRLPEDSRPAHVIDSAERQLAKTALGAERSLPFRHFDSTAEAITQAKADGYYIYALEQATHSTSLFDWQPQFPAAIVVGHETAGVADEVLKLADQIVEIPMRGQKESLNVAAAGSIALYWALFRTSGE